MNAIRRPTWRSVSLAAVLFVVTDWGAQHSGAAFWPGGPLDLTAHFITALIALWAVGRRFSDAFLAGALAASVLIDLDHIPGHLGHRFLTAGTPRPYTHSLLSIAVVLGLAAVVRRRRPLMLGIATGLALHFWRDVADPGAGVAMLWPFRYHGDSVPRWTYLVAMALLVGVVGARLTKDRAHATTLEPERRQSQGELTKRHSEQPALPTSRSN